MVRSLKYDFKYKNKTAVLVESVYKVACSLETKSDLHPVGYF